MQILALAAGERPSVLLEHAGERILLRVGQELPGTPFRLDAINNDTVAFSHDEHSVEISIRRDAP